MPTPVPTLVAVLILCGSAGVAFAQPTTSQRVSVVVRASSAEGHVQGVVRDDAGSLVGGVSVIAMGTTLLAVETDRLGRFFLALPPGEYILRAMRDGYVSTFREPVRVFSSALVERDITLVRERRARGGDEPGAVDQMIAGQAPGDHAHTDLAWRLRHIRRTVLRDEAPAGGVGDRAAGAEAPDAAATGSALDRAFYDSARAATAFFRDTDFSGQVNWVTTGSVALSNGRPEAWLSGSVAYLSVGAPVGTHGAWSVRGALSPGEPSSWFLLGEYGSEPAEEHAFSAGVSYAALRPGNLDPTTTALVASEARSAGALYAFDRWRVSPRLEVSYGLRLDAHDYLAGPPLISPELGARVGVAPRTSVVVEAVALSVAPGAAEFLPPPASGFWMPPQRTFSSVRQEMPLSAERIGRLAVGLEYTFGSDRSARTVSVRRFQEDTAGQLVTVFGLGRSGSSHYLTATMGDVRLDGWSFGFSGELVKGIGGSVEYRLGHVDWYRAGALGPLYRLAPSAVRSGPERLHDVSAAFFADIPGTSTRVSMAYRVSSGFSLSRDADGPATGGRFDIEVRQELPYQPLSGGTFDVLVGIRNLYRELGAAGSLYDELLTISPPVRFVGGIQVRF